jgi:hypothetical protein
MSSDIALKLATFDLALSSKNKYTLRDFKWVDNTDEKYIYGEVTISGVTYKELRSNGFYIHIPYTPYFKGVRLKVTFKSGGISHYVPRPPLLDGDSDEWFDVTLKGSSIKASELIALAESGDYYLRFTDDMQELELYNAEINDVEIIDPINQNAALLLECVPGNYYRYPSAGVGLVRWVNCSGNTNDLVDVLTSEFEADGVSIASANMDLDTNNLDIQLNG